MFVPSGAPPRARLNDPEDEDDPSGDRGMDFVDSRDFADQDIPEPATSSANMAPYARFLQSMPDYFNMTQDEYTKAIQALPRPVHTPPPREMSMNEAIQASYNTIFEYQV